MSRQLVSLIGLKPKADGEEPLFRQVGPALGIDLESHVLQSHIDGKSLSDRKSYTDLSSI